MRIATQLRVIAAASITALILLVLLLVWSFGEFRKALGDNQIVDAARISWYQQNSFRDQYLLYREDDARAQWDSFRDKTERLLRRAMQQFHTSVEPLRLERLRIDFDGDATVFRRIVANTEAMKAAGADNAVLLELDKRLASQLLLRANSVRDAIGALEAAGERHVAQTYQWMVAIFSVFVVILTVVTSVATLRIRNLMRRRLAPLHRGTRIVGRGDLSYRVEVKGSDEFSELALDINSMTASLEAERDARNVWETQRIDTLRSLQEITSRVPGAVYQFILRPDGSSSFPFASDGIRDVYRVSPQEAFADAAPVFRILHPDDREQIVASIRKSARDLTPWVSEYRVKYDDGTVRWLLGSSIPRRTDDGATLWNGFITDITERKESEEKLRLAASVFAHAREGIMITSLEGIIIDVNDAFTSITGFGRDEVVGQNPRLLSSGRQQPAFYSAMWGELIGKGHWHGEVWNRRKNGEVYAEMQSISVVRDAQGNPSHYVSLFSDITLTKAHQKQLEQIAHYDVLTGLPNRALLGDRMHQAMAQAQRRGQSLAVVFLDLDGFKAVNDRHGHQAGDQLLIAAATRMKNAMRNGDTLARIGGDEFVAVLLDLADATASVTMLSRLLAAAAEPLRYANSVLQVSASLGVTFYPQAVELDADQLLRQADQAMYQAKLAGKNRYEVFDADQDSSLRGHHESLDQIRNALSRREFVLHYQPKVNMRTGQVIGAEALIRWQHPDQGLLPPAAFLPVIEKHELAVEIGEWVFESVLTQMERWHAGGFDIPVSVNVGARQLQQADFTDRLSEMLARHVDIRHGDLELEVLETSALEDVGQASKVVEACQALGVRSSLDDFGTGYSSLTYLKHLPVAQLKIDQSFVRDMLDDPDDLAILEGVIGLGTALGREVIAEGVETVQHGVALLRLGCDLAQGYCISRPMPPEQMPGWVATWRPDPAWVALPVLSRDDLPLLFAGVVYRAWASANVAYIRAERDARPGVDSQQRRFGAWLEGVGATQHGSKEAFQLIESRYRQLHAMATELCQLRERGDQQQALARVGELHALRDRLLEQLDVLLQGTQASPGRVGDRAGEAATHASHEWPAARSGLRL